MRSEYPLASLRPPPQSVQPRGQLPQRRQSGSQNQDGTQSRLVSSQEVAISASYVSERGLPAFATGVEAASTGPVARGEPRRVASRVRSLCVRDAWTC